MMTASSTTINQYNRVEKFIGNPYIYIEEIDQMIQKADGLYTVYVIV